MHGAWFKKGDDYVFYLAAPMNLSQNFKMDRATAIMFNQDDPSTPADFLVQLAPDLFDVNALAKSGR